MIRNQLNQFFFKWILMRFPAKRCELFVGCVILALAAVSSGCPGAANEPSGFSGISSAGHPLKQKNTDNPEFKGERLKEPIELADMPPYAGKKVTFVVGTLFHNVKGGPSVTMEFSTADNPKKVLDWYKQSFEQRNWSPLDHMSGANGVAAMKSHNVCQVMTLAPTRADAQCDFLVRYKFYRAE